MHREPVVHDEHQSNRRRERRAAPEHEPQADRCFAKRRQLGVQMTVRDDGVQQEFPEKADGVALRVLRDEERHDVQPAIRYGGHGQEAPDERDAQLGEDGLPEPHAQGDPQDRKPAFGRSHRGGRSRTRRDVHPLVASGVEKVGRRSRLEAAAALAENEI